MESLLKKVNKEKVAQYHTYLESLDLSEATIKRRLSSLRKFTEWAEKEGYLGEIETEKAPVTKETPLPKVALFKNLRPTFPLFSYLQKAYIIYHSISITRYLHYGILVVFCAALGFGLYQQLTGPKAKLAEAYPSALTPPKRYLSFQGRLTDSSDNPITDFTTFVFKLYDTAGSGTPPTGGVQLWTSGNCSVDPDEDGIFSVLLGSDCGSEIAATVFSENAGVWVQITVGTSPSDETLSPRIRVATVGYALNAETLQGYPPGTGASMVPYIDSTGKITIAAASPTIESTSGTFAIKGRALSITTATGTNGNITIAPDGIGTLNINVGGTGPGSQVRITDANMVSGNLVSIYAGTGATGFDLLNLSSGSTETTKFSVDESGNTYVAGNLGVGTTNPDYKLDVQGGDFNVSGNLYTGGTQRLSSGGALSNITGYTQASGNFAFSGGGDFSVESAGFDVTTGGAVSGVTTLSMNNQLTNSYANTAAINLTGAGAGITFGSSGPYQIITGGSADLALMPGGNLGIGTTGPSQKLHVDGNMRLTGALYDFNNQAGTSGQILSTTVSGVDWVDISSVGVGGTGTQNYLPKWISSSTLGNSLIYEDGTNVGIGTTSPGQLLELYKVSGDPAMVFDIGGTDKFTLGVDDSVSDIFKIETGGSLTSTATPPFTITSGGNVGIGTTGPGEKLEVFGKIKLDDETMETTAVTFDGDTSAGLKLTNPRGYITLTPLNTGWAHIYTDRTNFIFNKPVYSVDDAFSSYDADLQLRRVGTTKITAGSSTVTIADTLTVNGSGNNYFAGNVGIGITNPLNRLDVSGSIAIGSLPLNVLPQSNMLYVSGNVGIGTTAPATILTIENSSSNPTLRISSGGQSFDPKIELYGTSSVKGSIWYETGGGDLYIQNNWENNSGDLFLKTRYGTIAITGAGNVGIGTTGPGAKLDINGDLKIGTVASVADNNQVLTVDSGIVKYIDTSLWDKSSSDDYGAWWLAGNEGTAQSIGAGNTASIIGGVGIGTTASATDTLTINVDESYGFNWTGNQSWAGISTFNNLVDLNNILDLDANDASLYAANIAQTGNGGGLYVSNTGSGTSFRVDDETSDTSSFVVDQYGNVGIGLISPNAKLEVSTSGYGLGSLTGIKSKVVSTGSVGSAYGGYFEVVDQSIDTIDYGYGVYSKIYEDSGIIETGYGFYADCDDAATCYGLYVDAGDAQVTTDWGIYVTGEDKNYLSGNVGIGTTNPGAKLDIIGDLKIGTVNSVSDNNQVLTVDSGIVKYIDTSLWDKSSSDDYGAWWLAGDSGTAQNIGAGNTALIVGGVGIGTTASNTDTLTVGVNQGYNFAWTGNQSWAGTSTFNGLVDINNILDLDANDASLYAANIAQTGNGGGLYMSNTGSGTSFRVDDETSDLSPFIIDAAGNVGIGTTGPTNTLSVLAATTTVANFRDTSNSRGFNIMTNAVGYGDFGIASDSSYGLGLSGGTGRLFLTSGSGQNIIIKPTGTGNIGIGTTGPVAKFDVAGTSWLRGAANNQGLYVDSSGNVGIGTTGPGAALHVESGDIRFKANSYNLSLWDNNAERAYLDVDGTSNLRVNADFDIFLQPGGSTAMFLDNSGNVGIGTTGPGAKLQINNADGLNSGISLKQGGTDWRIYVADTAAGFPAIRISGTTPADSYFWQGGWSDGQPANLMQVPTATLTNSKTLVVKARSGQLGNLFEWQNSSGVGLGVIDASGNVGIGTTGPGAKLDINGNLKIGSVASVSDNNQVLTVDSGIVKYIDTSSWDKNSSDDYGAWWLAGDTGTAQNIGAGNTAFIIGGVGIGTTASATDTLTVGVNQGYNFAWTGNQSWAGTSTFNGLVDINNILDLDANDASLYAANIAQTGNGGGLYMSNTGSGTSFRVDDETSDLSPFIIDNAGNVGVGTTNPGVKLDVSSGYINMDAGYGITFRNWSPTSEYLGYFERDYHLLINTSNSLYFNIDSNQNDDDTQFISFRKNTNYNSGTELMRIQESGNVGIGTTGPGYKLDVAGTGRFTGALKLDTVNSVSDNNQVLTVDSGIVKYIDTSSWDKSSADDYGAWWLAGDSGTAQNIGAGNTALIVGGVGIGTTASNTDTLTVGVNQGYNFAWTGNQSWAGTSTFNNLVDLNNILDLDANDASLYAVNIAQTGNGGGLYVSNTGSGTSFRVDDQASDLSPFIIDASGNVGIGTTGPVTKLQVGADSALNRSGSWVGTAGEFWGSVDLTNYQAPLIVMDTDTSYGLGRGGGIFFGGKYNDSMTEIGAGIKAKRESATASVDDWGLSFYTRYDNSPLNEVVRIDKNGNVGIGTTGPGAKLDINGNLKIGSVASVSDNNQVLTVDSGIVKYIDTSSWDKNSSDDYGAWWLAGDTGTAQNIGAGNTASIIGGVGIGTTASATDTLTVGVNQGYNFAWTGNQSWAGTSTFNGLVDLNNILDLDANDASLYAANIAQTGNGGGLYVSNTGTGFSLRVDDQASDTSSFVVDQNGNVGIGTTGPSAKLDVQGNLLVGSSGTFSNAQGWDGVIDLYGGAHSRLSVRTGTGAIDLQLLSHSSGWAGAPVGSVVGTQSNHPLSFMTNGVSRVTIDTSGKVGIGTTGPGAKLDINGNLKIGTVASVADNNQVLTVDSGIVKYIDTSLWDKSSADDYGAWWLAGNSGTAQSIGAGNTASILGGVGIGTTASATDTLTVGVNQAYNFAWTGLQTWSQTATFNGSVDLNNILDLDANDASLYAANIAQTGNGGGLYISNTGSGTSFRVDDASSDLSPFIIDSGGNVGIGTTSPTKHLDVVAAYYNDPTNIIRLTNGGFTYDFGSGYIGATNSQASFDVRSTADITLSPLSVNSAIFIKRTSGNVGIGTTGPVAKFDVAGTSWLRGAASNQGLYVDSSGNVGIGTTGPQTKLNISGSGTYTFAAGGLSFGDGDTGFYESADDSLLLQLANSDRAVFTANYVAGYGSGSIITGSYYLNRNAGAEATPTFTFGGNTDTGIYRPAANNLGFSLGGSEKVRIDSSGNVGIGTTEPDAKLTIGSGGANPELKLYGNDSGTDKYGKLYVNNYGYFTISTQEGFILSPASNYDLRVDGGGSGIFDINRSIDVSGNAIISGNLGIGTTNPGATLDINGNLKIGSVASIADNNQVLTVDSGIVKYIDTSSWDKSGSDDYGAWWLAGNSGTAQSIGAGNTASIIGGVGIGTTASATDTLTVGVNQGYNFAWTGSQSWAGTSTFNGLVDLNNILDLDANDASNYAANIAQVGNGGGLFVSNTGTNLSFRVDDAASDTSPFAIDADGNVGIGTTNPRSKLEIYANTGTGQAMTIVGADRNWEIGQGGTEFGGGGAFGIRDGYNESTRFIISGGGNVGIGTTNPGAKLGFATSTTAAGGIDFGGDVSLYRSAANALKTDDTFVISVTSPTHALQFTGTSTIISGDTPFSMQTTGSAAQGIYASGLWLDSSYSGASITAGAIKTKTLDLTLSPGSTGDLIVSTDSDTDFNVGSGQFFVQGSSGNVGIGTTGPGARLTIRGASGATDETALQLEKDSSWAIGEYLAIDWKDPGIANPRARIAAEPNAAGDWNLDFYTTTDGGSTLLNQMRITDDGNVGIGTTNPGAKLDIIGDLKIGTVNSVSDNNQVLTVDSGIVKYIDTSSWDKSGADDYGAWWLAGDSGITQSIGAGNTASIVGGVGIGTTASNTDTLTVGVNQAYNFAWTGNQSWAGTSTFNNLVDLNNILDLDANDASNYAANIAQTGNGGGLYVSNTGSGFSFRVDDQASDTSSFVIDQSGNVGIGTTGPGYKLEVIGTGYFSSTLNVSNDGIAFTGGGTITRDGGTGNLSIKQQSGANADLLLGKNNDVVILDNGNVGIGTTAPGQLLELGKSSGDPAVTFDIGGTDKFTLGVDDSVSDIFKIETGGSLTSTATPPFVITSGGNVGIGTTGPGMKFSLDLGSVDNNITNYGISGIANAGDNVGYVGQSLTLNNSTANASGYIRLARTASTVYLGMEIASQSRDGIRFLTHATSPVEVMRINAFGNVGIGTTGPSEKLEVAGKIKTTTFQMTDGASDGYIMQSDGSGNATWADLSSAAGPWTLTNDDLYPDSTSYNVAIGAIDAGSAKLYINGNVGIGTTAPSEKLEVMGNIALSGALSAGDTTPDGHAWHVFGTGEKDEAGITDAEDVYISGDLEVDGTLYAANIAGDVEGTGTQNYLAKWSSSETLDDSVLYDDGANIGIGLTNPSALIHISSTAAQNLFQVDDNGSGDTSPFVINQSGNVGIGTTAPGEKLEVFGKIKLDDETMETTAVTFDGDTSAGLKLTNPRGYITLTPLNTGWAHIYTDRTNFIFNKPVYSTANAFSSYDADLQLRRVGTTKITAGSSAVTIADTLTVSGSGNNYFVGNVGIGTTSPKNKLDVQGSVGIGTTYPNALPQSNMLHVSGNVGIGTTNPGAKLDINGDLKIGTVASVADNSQVLTVDSGIVKYIDTSSWDKSSSDDYGAWWLAGDTGTAQSIGAGNTASILGGVGIGTTASNTDTLTVGVNQAYNFAWTGSQSWSQTATFNGSIDLNNILDLDANDASLYAANIAQTGNGGGLYVSNTGSGTSFRVDDSASDLSPFIIDSGGNVGIGTTAPNEKLEITGNLRLPATTTTTGIIKMGADRYLHSYYDLSNTFLGVQAGNLTMSGTGDQAKYNTAIGYQALDALTTGYANTAIGYQSLTANDTGYGNFAAGRQALVANTSGYNNFAVGTYALYSNTDGHNNTAIGEEALLSNAGGDENVAIGFMALRTNSSGNSNIAIGPSALRLNSSGSSNIALGSESLYTNTGSNNIAIGSSTLDSGGAITENIAIGVSTMRYTTGSYNTAVGGNAAYYQGTGSNNVFIGYQAGRGSSSYDASGNILIGYQAGYNETNSNKLYIENSNAGPNAALIYGDFSTNILAFNGNVGIGTTGPSSGYKLDVNGNVNIGGTARIGSVPLVADNNQVLTVDSGIVKYIDTSSWDKSSSDDYGAWWLAGNSGTAQSIGAGNTASIVGGVGIGTTASATDTLTVGVNQAYNFAWTGNQSWAGTSTFNGLVDLNNILDLDANDASLYAANIAQAGNGGGLYVSNTGSGTSFRVDDAASDLSPFIIDNSGNVGIGTTGPDRNLDIVSTGETWASLVGGTANLVGYLMGDSATDYQGRVQYNNNDDSLSLWASNAQYLTILSTGNVGIGTTGPTGKLDVAGRGYIRGTQGGTPNVSYDSADLVIGDTSFTRPGFASGDTGYSSIFIQSSGKSSITFVDEGQDLSQISYENLKFTIGENVGWGNANVIMPGNVGIGTTGPGAKLDINGNLKIGTVASVADNNQVLTVDSGIVKYIDTSSWDKSGADDYGAWWLAGNSGTAQSIGAGNTASIVGGVGIGTTASATDTLTVGVNQGYNFAWTGNQSWAGTSTFNGLVDINNILDLDANDASNYAANIAQTGNGGGLYVSNTGTGFSFRVDDAASDLSPFIIDAAGNVGIGTTGPVYTLDVNGSLRTTGDITLTGSSRTIAGSGDIILQPGEGYYGSLLLRGRITSGYAGDPSIYMQTYNAANVSTNRLYITSGEDTAKIIIQNANVGIGTTGPGYKLDVAGTGRFTGALRLDTVNSVADNNQVLTVDSGIVKYIDTSSWDKSSSDDYGAWWLAGDSGTAQSIGAGNTASIIGGVGIGTTASATDTLTVGVNQGYNFAWTGNQSWAGSADFNGDVSIADSSIALDNATSTNLAVTGDFSINTSQFFLEKSTGEIGIGTASPGQLLELYKASGDPAMVFDIGGTDKFTLGVDDSVSDIFKIETGGSLTATATPPFVINSSGSIGIGTSGPGYKTHIEGTSADAILYVKNLRGSGGEEVIQADTASTNTSGYLGGHESAPYTNQWYGVRGTTQGGIAVIGRVIGASGDAARFLGGSVGIGSSSFSPGAHMLDIESIKGTTGNSAIRAKFYSDGIPNQEFGAIAHRENQWNAIYGKQGSGGAALYTEGEVNMISGNVGIGTTVPTHKLELESHTTATGGIALGTDIELYREAANVLRMAQDDTLSLWGGAAANGIQRFQVTGDTVPRLTIQAGGTLSWGAGGASAQDTDLYRDSANKLRTSDTLIVDGNVGIGTTGPGAALHVKGSSSNAIRLEGSSPDELADLYVGGDGRLIISTTPGSDSLGMIDFRSEDDLFGYVFRDSSGAVTTTYLNMYVVDTTTDYVNFVINSGNGTTGLVLDDNNNVGIGITGPNAKLEIMGTSEQLRLAYNGSNYVSFTIGNDGDLLVKPTGTGQVKFQPTTDSTTFLQVLDADGGMPILNIDSDNERVGIGTSAPGAKLDIGGATSTISNTSGDITIDAASNNISFAGDNLINVGEITAAKLMDSASSSYYIDPAASGTSLYVNGDIALGMTSTNDDDYIYLDASTNEYLEWDDDPGQFVLSDDLVPNADDTFNLGSSTARWADIYLGPGTIHLGSSTADEYTIGYDTSNNRLEFNVNGSGPAEMVMDSSGNVGIGTTGPWGKLTISGDYSTGNGRTNQLIITGEGSNFQDRNLYIGINTTYDYASIAYVNEGDHWGPLVLQEGGGNVGIGTTSPDTALDVGSGAVKAGNGYALGTRQGSNYRIDVGTTSVSCANVTWVGIQYTWSVAFSSTPKCLTTGHGGGNWLSYHLASAGCTTTLGQHNIYQGSGAAQTCTAQILGYGPTTMTDFDLAEGYKTKDQTIESGEVVCIDPENNSHVVKCTKPYDATAIGIVSTEPGLIIGDELTPDSRLVGLQGRVPVKVTLENGPIERGDPLTPSATKPGFAMKAKKAGQIIGKALQPFHGTSTVLGENAFDGLSEENITEIMRETKESGEGQTMAFINVSWYDPDVYLTDVGELNIQMSPNPSAGSGQVNPNESEYSLVDATGKAIERVGAFAEVAIAELQTGLINAQEIITEKLTSQEVNTQKLITPLVETQEIDTQRISLSEIEAKPGEDVIVNLAPDESQSEFGQLIVKGADGTEVATIDAQGNASFSGELTASKSKFGQLLAEEITGESLEVSQDATIAGTLYAKKVVAEEIVGLESKFGKLLAATVSATYITQNITNITQIIEPSPTPSPELTPTPSPEPTISEEPSATDSGELLSDEEVEELVNQILGTSLESTPQANLAEVYGDSLTINEGLTVLGTTSLADTTIAGSLNVGATMTLADNSINTLTGPLYLQNLGLGGIDILAGKITIDEQGNAVFEGNVTVKGRLALSEIEPLPEQENLVVDLSPETEGESRFGQLLIKGVNDEIVASVDASGSAFFTSLGLEADYSATESGAIIAAYDNYLENGYYNPAIKTNATAGIGILPAGETEIQIYNPNITEQSLVYLVPASDTKNKVLFVKAKHGYKEAVVDEYGQEVVPAEKGWFKAAIDTSITKEIRFNWWIVGGKAQ